MFDFSPDVTIVLWTDLGVLLAAWSLTRLLDPGRAVDRLLFGGATSLLICSYFVWRWTNTLPASTLSFASLWQDVYFAFEAIAIVYTLMSIAILLRHSDHSHAADVEQARLEKTGKWPAVDVFICTYNEPLDVLEKSVLLAKAMDYPHFRVWVLDDTRRAWLREYCAELDVGYLTRSTNEWAKAGNLNNGLSLTAGPDAAPLILVLDADFAPHANLLSRTVGLFRDERVGIVQTPQLYFNADPIQHNLMAAKSWVDDQRIFFDIFQPAKDAWDSAFCVGTTFLVRRDRLEEIGGFPCQSVSEDINLTYTMLRYGYLTRWLNERLSVGLAAEGLPEYVTQRARWCLGTIQVALLKNGPFRGADLSVIQRLHYLHGVLNWLCKPYILLMLAAPAIYWFLGVPAFQADYVDFLRCAAPALIFFYTYSGWISRRRTLPVFMEVTHMLTAVAITRTLITCCYRPFGRPFKVTDKGGDRASTVVRWGMVCVFASFLAVSLSAIGWALAGPDSASEATPVDRLNLIWAGISALLSGIACIVCIERPRSHREELFETERAARLSFETGELPCVIDRLSTVDAGIRLPKRGQRLVTGASVQLSVDGVGDLQGTVTLQRGRRVTIGFEIPEPQRRALVVRLYGAPNYNVALQADMGGALGGLLRRSFGRN